MKNKRGEGGGLQSITLLKLKLKLEPDQAKELQRIAELCRRGRNAGAMDWLLRQHGKPESPKQSERLCKHPKYVGKDKSESSKIYHAVRAESDGLTATIHSMLANQVNSFLNGKLDWRRGKADDGKRPRRKDAILKYEDRPPFFTAIEIPVRAVDARFSFGDIPAMECRLTSDGKTVLKISTGSLSAGHKRQLHALADGARKLADSKLLLKDDEWYWYLPMAFETTAIVSDRQCVLWPTLIAEEGERQLDRPFRLVIPDRQKPWGIGDGHYLLAQTHRFTTIKKQIGWRYRQRNGAGHGRKKVDAKQRQVSQALANVVDEVRRRMIVDIVRQCEIAGCGTLLYREPSLPLRERTWFAKHGLEWNWTRLLGDLENACKRRGIVLIKEQWKLKDAKDAA